MSSFSKSKRLLLPLLVLLIAGLVVPAVFAQETTGGLQGTVKDPSGAVVSGATVDVTSPSLIGKKSVTTDGSGYFRFANLPPGTYTITVTAPNFRSYKQEGIGIATGHLPSIDVALQVGTASETVEVTGNAPIVDVTQSKVQTNVTEEVLANVPKGRSFTSVIQFAPGARSEPLQGGFQIDGASNAENSYLVEGQETASIRTGAYATEVPMEFIQEVQIKSSGFEAEYGGALGGVVNVIQKRGSNTWHGSLVTYYSGDQFNAAPNRYLRTVPGSVLNSLGPRSDRPWETVQPLKDHYRTISPGFETGGYILKDRLWVFGSFVPSLSETRRGITFASTAPVPGYHVFDQTSNTFYTLGRADFLVTQKIRVYASFQDNYSRTYGLNLPNQEDAFGKVNTSATNNITNYERERGQIYPNRLWNLGADVTLTPNLVATTRFGQTYNNTEDRGVPVGVRYLYVDTNYPYLSTPSGSALTQSLGGATLSSTFYHPAGYSSMAANTSTAFDIYQRRSFTQDIAYFKKGWGTHNLKGGYAFNKLVNDVNSGYQTSQAYIAYGQPYDPLTIAGVTNCKAIVASNITTYGALNPGGATNGTSCQGNWGTLNIRELGTTGVAQSYNHSLYFQDAWTVGHGVTLNLGLRFDKESLPSFVAGLPGINFGWGNKIAPRLGAAWDMFGTGKFKVYGSFGYFYDIMKYELPRGSFGGDYWHDCVYALDQPNWTTIVPVRGSDNHFCTPAAQATGTGLPARFIENTDWRVTSNNPNQPGSLGATGFIDPNLKPMKQHEYVFGADWAIMPTLKFESRYARKRLDATIEDAGTITSSGEQYYIVNPGMGINATQPNCNGCPRNPKAVRNYDGLEFRLTRSAGTKWFASLSYTYSRLYGNYSGLTATDVSDGGAARNSPNVDRAFDEPFMSFNAYGKAINGPLGTDRPHTFKAYGYYRLKWWRMETLLGGYQQWFSGTPLSSYVSVQGAPVFVEGRGNFANVTRDPATGNWVLNGVNASRTPSFSQTDFSFIQQMHVSKTYERLVLGFEANLTNLFNQHSPTLYSQNLIQSGLLAPYRCLPGGTGNCTATEIAQAGFSYGDIMSKGFNYIALANDPAGPKTMLGNYGQATGWQGGRNMRFAVRFTF